MKLLTTINWAQILKIDEFDFSRHSKKIKIEVIRKALKSVFHGRSNLEKTKNKKVDFLFVKSLSRADYDELFERIHLSCQNKKIIDIKYSASKWLRVFPVWVFLKNMLVYRYAFRANPLLTIYLIIKMTQYLEVYERMNNYQCKFLIVFADMQPVDNMLVQIANQKGIKTVTMQHGLYVDYKDYPTENAVNYLHAVAKIFLAWGDDTAELIKRHHPKTITRLVGKPLAFKKTLEKSNFFTIVFDSNYFMQHNLELLAIAYQVCDALNLKVNIRFHPYNRQDTVPTKREVTLVNNDIMASRFVLGHTSTMLYDCMITGIPSLRYKTDKPSINTPAELEFSNADECMKILNNKNTMAMDFNQLGKNYFKYSGEESIQQYKRFFDELAETPGKEGETK